MADFSPPAQQGTGKRKTKKLSTRIDLTPMVDLGFLLITFFIFTTSMAEPKSLKLVMPDDRHVSTPMPLRGSATLQLILDKEDRVWYYHGDELATIRNASYGNELRKVIIDKKEFVLQKFGKDEMTLIIKPTKYSSLKNVVDILDEVLINDVKLYVITEPSEADLRKIQ